MNKKEIIEIISNDASISKSEANKALESITRMIQDTVKSGGSITLPNIGKFEAKTRAARKGINPLTKEPLNIPETRVPKFKALKSFKDLIKKQ